MRPVLPKFKTPESQQLAQILAQALSNISIDNMKTSTVAGTTAAMANTQSLFKHSLGGVPAVVFIVEGNAYLSLNGRGVTTLDIRSTGTSEPFVALAVR